MKSTSFMEYVQQGMKDNIFNFTKNGECSHCGKCCSNILPMNQNEIDVIHRYIKKHHIKECRHLLPLTDSAIDMTCPFLDTDKSCEKCRIYKVRPMICRKFICDSEQRAKLTREECHKTRRPIDVRATFFGKET